MRVPNQTDLFQSLEKEGLKLDEFQKKKIIERIDTIASYKPRVGVFGKTGVGKSSLANALFGTDICKISDVAACTREPQEILLSLAGKNGFTLVDVPGVGESTERDSEYSSLYQKLLPELDLVLWVLKGDDRAFTSDQLFYENVVKPHLSKGKPFFFVLNQIDKVEPFREWDISKHEPGPKQMDNIRLKINEVARYFNVAVSKVVPVSANEKYNLVCLIDEIVFALPSEKLITFAKNVDKELISDKAKEHIKTSSTNYVLSGAGTGASIGAMVGGPVGALICGAIGGVMCWVSSKCYISTATVLAMKKSDDCEELETLREYRDEWLKFQANGREIIEDYYTIAPRIVDAIDELDNSDEIYLQIWREHIFHILQDIRLCQYNDALGKYKVMVCKLSVLTKSELVI